MVKIAFHDNGLSERGTTRAIWDYAYYNKHLLNNKSIIIYNNNHHSNQKNVIDRIKKEFEVFSYNNWNNQINTILKENKIDILYIIKAGDWDGKLPAPNICKTVVHCVFWCSYPHGDIYSSIAPWVRENNGKFPFVPHMVNIKKYDHNNTLREKLGIPKNTVVFGGYGGKENFNLQEVHKVVYSVALKNANIYFLFSNFNRFCPQTKNIIHLPQILEIEDKVTFINTCDAMLWARRDGEVFSMAHGEFSFKNKPIICKEIGYLGHKHLLKDKAIWYDTPESLYNILTNLNSSIEKDKDWNAYKEYTPELVMKKFKEVFIDPFY